MACVGIKYTRIESKEPRTTQLYCYTVTSPLTTCTWRWTMHGRGQDMPTDSYILQDSLIR